MSSEIDQTARAGQPSWPVLLMVEQRILGVLVEKAKTTPDAYPLSLNALVTGSNQKSNRDPLMNLNEGQVEVALEALNKLPLVSRITGGRVERWRHLLYESWKADKVELAVLAELLLRGPQTEGELRGRASRMEPIEDLEALRVITKRLADRNLVVYLTPEGRRGTVLTHGFHPPEDLPRLRQVHGAAAQAMESSPASSPNPAQTPRAAFAPSPAPSPSMEKLAIMESQLTSNQSEIADLRNLVAELQAKLAALTEEVRQFKKTLGD